MQGHPCEARSASDPKVKALDPKVKRHEPRNQWNSRVRGLLRYSFPPAGHPHHWDPRAFSVEPLRCRRDLAPDACSGRDYSHWRVNPSTGFLPELQGLPLVMPVRKRTLSPKAVQFLITLAFLRFLTASRRFRHPESVVDSCERPDSLVSLAPSGSCTSLASVAVTGSCRSCPLHPGIAAWRLRSCDLILQPLLAESGLQRVVPQEACVCRPCDL